MCFEWHFLFLPYVDIEVTSPLQHTCTHARTQPGWRSLKRPCTPRVDVRPHQVRLIKAIPTACQPGSWPGPFGTMCHIGNSRTSLQDPKPLEPWMAPTPVLREALHAPRLGGGKRETDFHDHTLNLGSYLSSLIFRGAQHRQALWKSMETAAAPLTSHLSCSGTLPRRPPNYNCPGGCT